MTVNRRPRTSYFISSKKGWETMSNETHTMNCVDLFNPKSKISMVRSPVLDHPQKLFPDPDPQTRLPPQTHSQEYPCVRSVSSVARCRRPTPTALGNSVTGRRPPASGNRSPTASPPARMYRSTCGDGARQTAALRVRSPTSRCHRPHHNLRHRR